MLPTHLSSLLKPQAYPHPVAEIQLVETHISWVLLTGERAYKIKRPVRYPFVDLRSEDTRRHLCEEELRLNRRFAPELYLEVVPVTVRGNIAHIGGGAGEVVEHAVCMRQFSRDGELSVLVDEGHAAVDDLETFGRYLAQVHAKVPSDTSGPFGTVAAVRGTLVSNLDQLDSVAARQSLEPARDLRLEVEALLERLSPLMKTRKAAGRVRECHGDLHCRNVVRHEGRLVAFDCLEFEPAFRWIDVAQEIAFLWMDLQRRGAIPHATAFLNGYLSASGDYEAARLLRLYGAHYALVRAKVDALKPSRDGYLSYLGCARNLLKPPRPRVILMSGFSGSGKTWLASRLAPMLPALHVRSDVERKRLAGLAEHDSSGSTLAGGLYSSDKSAATYERLAECAAHAVAGGFTVIVDATFQRREDRARFVRLGSEAGVPVTMIRCSAPDDVLRSRIQARSKAGSDASEADLSVLEWQRRHAESVDPGEAISVIDADTSRDTIVEDVRKALG